MRLHRFADSCWEAGKACEIRKGNGNSLSREEAKPPFVFVKKRDDDESTMTCGHDATALGAMDDGLSVAAFRAMCRALSQNRAGLTSVEFGQTLVYNGRELWDYNAMMLEAAMCLNQNKIVEELTLNENSFGAHLTFTPGANAPSTASLLSIAHWIRGSKSIRKLTTIIGNYSDELSFANSQIAMGFLECIVCGSSLGHRLPQVLTLRELNLHCLGSSNLSKLLAALLKMSPQLENVSLSNDPKMLLRTNFPIVPDIVGNASLYHALMKHPSLTSLKLVHVSLKMSQTILSGVRLHAKLSEVSLSGDFNSDALEDFLRNNSAVQKLALSSITVYKEADDSETGTAKEERCGLWRCLTSAGSLQTLQIADSDLREDADQCQKLFARNTIQKIVFDSCRLPKLVCEAISNTLEHKESELRHLSLAGATNHWHKHKQLGEDHLQALAPGLVCSLQLRELNFEGNRFTPSALLLLAQLIPQIAGLRALGIDLDDGQFASRCASAIPSLAEGILKSQSLQYITRPTLVGVEHAAESRSKILFAIRRNRLERRSVSLQQQQRHQLLLLPAILASIACPYQEAVQNPTISLSLMFHLIRQKAHVVFESSDGARKRRRA